MISGTVYGVVLNDAEERARLAGALSEPPYRAPPVAPVLYIKPRNCLCPSGSQSSSDGLPAVSAAATIGLIIGRDASRVSLQEALDHVAGAALVLDLSEPCASHYRPAVRQRCRDGFLPVGNPVPFDAALLDGGIVTRIDGRQVHRLTPARLIRDAAGLIADVSAFMTLSAGDMLLIGLAYDAPFARPGQRVEAAAPGFEPVSISLKEAP